MNLKYKAFKKNLFNKNVNKRILFDHLKANYSFKDQEYIINRLPKAFETLIYGNPFLNKVTEFGLKDLSIFETEEMEMNWSMHLFIKYANEINNFIIKKINYETQFLKGNYELSKLKLTEIINISHSYWGLENSFLQTQYEKGLEHNFKLLSKTKNLEVKDPLFFYLIQFLSNKVEEDISYFSYVNILESSLNFGMGEDYKSYILYRLNSINHDYTNINGLLWVSSNLSIIDKYILFKDIVGSIITNPINSAEDSIVKKQSILLSKYINDPFLDKVNTIITNSIHNESFSSKIEIELIDFFTVGEYQEVITRAKNVFSKNITFSIIEVFVKAHIHLGLNLTIIFDEKTLLDTLAKLVFNVLLRNKYSNEAIIELLTISNAISSFDISKGLLSFINYHISKEEKIENTKRAFIFSTINNPIHYEVLNELRFQKNYLKNRKDNFSITSNFFLEIIDDNSIKKISEEPLIPAYRRSFYNAKNNYQKGEFTECKVEILNLFPKIEKISYLKEQCVKLLFFSFIELKEYDSAIDLYVDNYIYNEFIVSKINAESFSGLIVKKRWKGFNTANINFPIFMYLAHDKTPPKYIAYDLFMRSQKITLPSELLDIKGIDLKKAVFFLKNVANQKIISLKAIVFKNSTEVLNERIAICQLLSKFDNNSIDIYNKEISDITQRITVQQRIKEIDESKIYIDETGILEKELNDVKKSFNRFKNISQILKESNIDVTGIGYDALNNLLKGNIDTETYQKSMRKTDVQFELFTQLFLEIRDKFLFSNQYGLDYYLSQRIRHGSIVNQIRKSFKTHNLVTTKSSKSDEYLINKFWLNKFDISAKQIEQFNKRMSLFSSNIDRIITNLKNNYIQIKTEDQKTKQTGWFDYMYIPIWGDSKLHDLYVKELQFITDFETFLKPIFDVLWEMTEINLNTVRNNINFKIKPELIKELEQLEIDLKKIFHNKNIPNLYGAIADCRTNVQADLDYAIRWFNKSKNYEIDFTVNDALNTSLQILNNIISPTALSIDIEDQTSKSMIKGIYFTHFVDLIKIFITNISDYYAKVDIENKTTSILLSQTGNTLLLEFRNSLEEDEDIDALKIIIDKKQAQKQTNITGIRGEGSTGFPKANNILKNVFRNNNTIHFDISEKQFVVKCEIVLNNLAI